jgi:hypothetical protein
MDKPHKKTNPWVAHVRSFALKNGITYGCALSDPRCKQTYNTGDSMSPPKSNGEMTARELAKKIKNIELTAQVRKEKILKKAPEIQKPKDKNDNNEDLSITEYKGDKIKGNLKTQLKYSVVDESTLLKPLRKRIHIILEPTNRRNRDSNELFFTNSINESDILKDIKKYYDINLIKKYDILPFDKLDIKQVEIASNVSETWNMPKISIGARRR